MEDQRGFLGFLKENFGSKEFIIRSFLWKAGLKVCQLGKWKKGVVIVRK